MPPSIRNRPVQPINISAKNEINYLNTLQLSQLEQSYRKWVEKSLRSVMKLRNVAQPT